MDSNLFIKYKGTENDSEIDLATLGESILGFDLLIREIIKVAKINGNVNIGVCKTRKGSLIVDIVIVIIKNKDCVPFEKIPDLLNFLKVVDPQQFLIAKGFFGVTLGEAH